MKPSFQIDDTTQPVRVLLTGEIDGAVVDGLTAAIARWTPASDRPPTIVDLSGVTAVGAGARDALVQFSRALVPKVGRHAYLATTPQLRGLVLWVLHVARDVEGRTVGNDGQAQKWLAGDAGRLESHFRLAGIDEIPARAREGKKEELSLGERVGATAILWISRITFGYFPAFTRELVHTYGLQGVKQWGEAVEGAVGALTERFGDETAQLLIALAAVWNACSYCTIGHLYALNVLYFRRTGRLFPIDEREVPRWYTVSDEALIERIVERLQTDEFEHLIPLVRRQFEIRTAGPEIAESDDDRAIVRANAAWDLVNECTIMIDTDDIPPLHPGAARARGVQKAYGVKRGRGRR